MGSLKVARFRPTQGARTTRTASTPTAASPNRAAEGHLPGAQGRRHQEGRYEQDQLRSDQGFRRTSGAEQGGGGPGGRSAAAGPRPTGSGPSGAWPGVSRHQDAVGDPEVRRQRGQAGRHQTDPRTGHAPAQQAHTQDHAGPENGHGQALQPGAGVDAEGKGHRADDEGGPGRMGRGSARCRTVPGRTAPRPGRCR